MMPPAALAHALDGVRVLDLSRLLPGPYLTMVLADLGADVIKVEDPKVGDYLRIYPPFVGGVSARFLALNRGKRSLALDLKTPAGRAALLRLVAKADVLVESFRPGVMAKLGLDWDALAAANPRLIACSISGFGQTGPYAHRAGHDLGYIALAGALAMSGGDAGQPPRMPGVQIADLAGGSLWAATAITAALFQRERTGRGACLDISMTEGALALLAAELANLEAGVKPSRGTETLNGGMAGYHVYRTADDQSLAVAALEPKFWSALQTVLGRPLDFAEVAGDAAAQARVRAALAAVFAQKTRAEWEVLLAAHDCCVEPVLELHELPGHPLHQARGVFIDVPDGHGGTMRQVRTPLGAPVNTRPPPTLGQHSVEVLQEAGLSVDEIAALR